MLLAFLVTMVWTGRGIGVEREILILFDLLLVVVFGLLLYSISARDPLATRGLLDWIQLTLVGTALVVDVLALWAIGTRISDFGFTPNREAALGENVILLFWAGRRSSTPASSGAASPSHACANGRLRISTSSPPGRLWLPFSSLRCSGSPERHAEQLTITVA